jgi:hypothetical protein
MVKIWIIVVVLAGMTPDGKQDLMVFPQPQFETSAICIDYVRDNSGPLMAQTWRFYGPRNIEQIYCVDQERFLEYTGPKKPNNPELST